MSTFICTIHTKFINKKIYGSITRYISLIWTRGESNPCPKAYSPRFLPSQSVFCYSLCDAPTDRLTVSVASYFYFRLKALPKEFPTWMTPVTEENPCGTSRLLLLRSGLRRSDVLHVRQQMLIRYYQRLYLVIRLLR